MKNGTPSLVLALLSFSLLVTSPPSLADTTDTPPATTSDGAGSDSAPASGAATADTGSTTVSAPSTASETVIPTPVVSTPVTPVSESVAPSGTASRIPTTTTPTDTSAVPISVSPTAPPVPESTAADIVLEPAVPVATMGDVVFPTPAPAGTVMSSVMMMGAAAPTTLQTDTSSTAAPDPVTVPVIILSEIQIAGNGTNDDFVELYNPGSDAFSLKGFELRRRTKTDTTDMGSLFHAFSDSDSVPANGYFLWANKDGSAEFIAFADARSANATSPALATNNSLALFDSKKTIIDAAAWGDDLAGPFTSTVNANPDKNTSLVRDPKTLSWSISDHPTPTNSTGQTVKQPGPLPSVGTIIINELYPNPNTDMGESEWIELRNTGDVDMSLAGWKLKDASTSAGYTFPTGANIGANGFLSIGADVSKIALNNTGTESLTLLFPDGSVADSFTFDGTERGASYAKNDAGTFLLAHAPTPGSANAFDPMPVIEPVPPVGTVRINELFPNPVTKGEPDEWVELRNAGNETASLVGWSLRSGAGMFRFTAHLDTSLREIPANGFLVLPRSLTRLALRNSDGNVTLLAPDGSTLMDSVSYTSTTEGNSYGYFAAGRYRWSKALTPGADNVFGKEPSVRKSDIPKKGYVNTLIPFSATGNKKNMKYVWDFGDGHKSYLDGPSHRFAKTGTFEGTLTLRDGIEEVVKKFTIKIGKYPNRDLHLTKLCPNPTGTDTGNEWIRIKNDDTKRIDLSGWVIATGSDSEKLVNHVILSKRFIAPGEEIVLTHDDAKFTLPNRQAAIELRRPDGKTMQGISYQTDKDIEEDAVYTDTGNGWAWILPASDSETVPTVIAAPDATGPDAYETGITTDPGSDKLSFGEFVSLGTPYDPALPDSLPQVLGASDERRQSDDSSSDSFLDALFRMLNGFVTGTI
ncbi:MAG TPA: lamin tail domain-containing protein [Candidatus Fimivivens sp.]|nr:lamin tail domain-containing protein [Candidatus Fimivivens sp.]